MFGSIWFLKNRHSHVWRLSEDAMSLASLFQDSNTVGNDANTNEKNLHTYSMPGGTLAKDGDSVKVYSLVRNANNANNKSTTLVFGATTIGASTTLAASNNWWVIEALITRVSATSQKAVCWVSNVANEAAWNSAAGGNVNLSTPAETLSGAVDIVVKGASPTTGAANDVQAILTVMYKISAA